jgi:protein-S-isoprenylcysteine O-methyltransferase Ste14
MHEARPAAQAAPAAVLIVLVVGIALVVIGQFFLDSLSNTSDTWHWIQHGVIFAGGLAVGGAATLLYIAGRRPD